MTGQALMRSSTLVKWSTRSRISTKNNNDMDRVILSVDELNAIVKNAVNTALDSYKKGDEETLISRDAAAKRLGVDVSTLWRWNRSAYLKTVKIGRTVWYTEASIRRLERGEREAL